LKFEKPLNLGAMPQEIYEFEENKKKESLKRLPLS
jgi:hypothetical protein